jgi:hypothetical protein
MSDAVVTYGSCFVTLSRISTDVNGDDVDDDGGDGYDGETEAENSSNGPAMICI